MDMKSSLWILAVTALLAAGCGSEENPASPVGDPSRVVVSLEANPASLAPGETADVVVRITNVQAAPVTLNFHSGCVLVFSVEDALGNRVGPEAMACTDDLPVMELGPGKSRAVTFRWAGTGTGNVLLGSGTYRLIGAVTALETNARSAPVPFDITD